MSVTTETYSSNRRQYPLDPLLSQGEESMNDTFVITSSWSELCMKLLQT